jgi:tRNA (mo5U34)-methyltransferase
MNGDQLLQMAHAYGAELDQKKKAYDAPFNWYPYGTLHNFVHLRDCFNQHPLETLTRSKHLADIGGADGDLAFFLNSLGYRVDVIDNAPTNYNGLQGVKMLIDRLSVRDSVSLLERDIDEQFTLPSAEYDLVFLLGILYHLKNPYYILEKLSHVTRNLLLSTRVMRFTPDGTGMQGRAVAYLVNPDESNNDATNYWIFTDFALRRLVARCGWHVTWATTVGDTATSNPADANRDERAFMLLRSARL